MKETWNVLDPDEYVKHNPFMGYTNMKIEKISPECSEISMKITHGVTNLMGMVHGGMLYALADVVTGLTARADGRKYVIQSLSGGNQQKVIIARWLANNPDILI